MKITGIVKHCILTLSGDVYPSIQHVVILALKCLLAAWAGGENLMDTGHGLRNANDI